MIKLENFSNYEIFPEEGRIFSLKTNRFIGSPMKNGYWKVTMQDDNGKQKTFKLHRLIWMSVHGDIPEGLEINHKSERKDENFIANLELVTHKENCNYGTRNARSAEKQSKQVAAYKDGVLAMVFPSTAEAHRNGYKRSNVSQCCNGKLPHYKEYQWLYFDDCPPLFIDVA